MLAGLAWMYLEAQSQRNCSLVSGNVHPGSKSAYDGQHAMYKGRLLIV
jgi:hypothetical protein